ncbi:MAG: hypothetical protein MUC60_00120, partial [Oscillatoria sp. Prado101]|nr:hypothetical protein [Oscillatoria sp. Prado101]
MKTAILVSFGSDIIDQPHKLFKIEPLCPQFPEFTRLYSRNNRLRTLQLRLSLLQLGLGVRQLRLSLLQLGLGVRQLRLSLLQLGLGVRQ